jgi:hypothetical protein
VIKLRTMKLAGQVAPIGREEASTGFWWGNLREIDNLVNPVVDGKIILRRNFRIMDEWVWNGLCRLRIETGGGHL